MEYRYGTDAVTATEMEMTLEMAHAFPCTCPLHGHGYARRMQVYANACAISSVISTSVAVTTSVPYRYSILIFHDDAHARFQLHSNSRSIFNSSFCIPSPCPSPLQFPLPFPFASPIPSYSSSAIIIGIRKSGYECVQFSNPMSAWP